MSRSRFASSRGTTTLLGDGMSATVTFTSTRSGSWRRRWSMGCRNLTTRSSSATRASSPSSGAPRSWCRQSSEQSMLWTWSTATSAAPSLHQLPAASATSCYWSMISAASCG
uniref:Uncharacterized protein n=1 Tax=Arundo donax TaxID=35708 RepID=A0A0A9BII2_ARUDO